MAAFARASQRGAMRTLASLAVVAVSVVLSGCSLLAPATFEPRQSIAAATDVASPAATPEPTPSAIALASPTPEPPASPPPPAAAWRSIVTPLAAPAAWLDFGFASNGDILAIGTADAAADPLHLFVARFSPGGR